MKILVADDHPTVHEAMRFLCKEWGYKGCFVPNGYEAVREVRANQYDLCLMNTNMPVMDGYEATERIRNELKEDMPIVILTADPKAVRISWLKACGINNVVDKPFDPYELREIILDETLRLFTIARCANQLKIIKEKPMDTEFQAELEQIYKKDLRKVKISGSGTDVIVHKNATNKWSYDFNVKKLLVTKFINRDIDRPTLCELYAPQLVMPQTYILGENKYKVWLEKEDHEFNKYRRTAATGKESKQEVAKESEEGEYMGEQL